MTDQPDEYEIVPVQAYLVRWDGQWIIDENASPWVFYDQAEARALIDARRTGEMLRLGTNPPQVVPEGAQ